MRIGFVTVANGPFLPQAVLLARSVRAQHPEADMVLVWAECLIAPPAWLADEFTAIICSEELVHDNLADMTYRYDLWQFCWAHKPLALRWMLECNGSDLAIFLDSDIRVHAPLTRVVEAAARGADVILSPHICDSVPHRYPLDDEALLANGTYNAGMIAVRASASGRAFLEWYVSVLKDRCLIDRERGLYGDQKWLDMAPSFVERVAVVRDAGYNLAYWNAHQRTLVRRNGEWFVSGEPLVFFHLSQFSYYSQSAAGYFEAYFTGAGQNYHRLIDEYHADLLAITAGHDPVGATPSAAPSDCIRKAYSAGAPIILGDLDAVTAGAVDWLNTEVPHWGKFGPFYITRLYDHIWHRRQDIRHNKFDINTHAGQRRYMRWLIDVGRLEEGIPESFLAPAREMLQADEKAAEAGLGRELSVEERLAEAESALQMSVVAGAERETQLSQARELLAAREADLAAMSAAHRAKEEECAQRNAEFEICTRERTNLAAAGQAQAAALAAMGLAIEEMRQELSATSSLAERRKDDVEVLSATLQEILRKVGEEEERYLERLAASRSEIARLAADLAAHQAGRLKVRRLLG